MSDDRTQREGLAKLVGTGVGLGICGVGLVVSVVYGMGGSAGPVGSAGTAAAGLPWVSLLPALNVSLNGLTALLLILGRLRIAAGDERAHQRLMKAALAVSTLFLISYLSYHAISGETHYPPGAPLRVAYLIFLASHILASAVSLPMILVTVIFAITGRRSAHRRLARWTWPLWLYVSVTGIGVFLWLQLALS